MNYLQLAQALRQEAGITGTGPAAVTNQSGENKRLVDWVNQAWLDIQIARPDWRWMRSQARVSATSGDGTYLPSEFTDDRTSAAISNFGTWVADSFSIYKNSIGQSDERELPYLGYDDWRRLYDFGSEASLTDYPYCFTVDPADFAVRLGRKPNDTYIVRGDFYHCASSLAANSDTPGLPTQFHHIIVWRALMFYGEYESASESYQKGKNNYDRWLSRLETNQAPPIGWGPPLVR